MKKIYLLLSLLILKSIPAQTSHHDILEDTDFCNKMIQQGKVSFQTLVEARMNRDPEAIKNVMVAGLETRYLSSILEQYSDIAYEYFQTQKGKKALQSFIIAHALDPNYLPLLLTHYAGGKEGFYSDCQQNPYLYSNFHDALTEGFLTVNPISIKTLTLFIDNEFSLPTYLPWDEGCLSHAKNKKYNQHTFFLLFNSVGIKNHPTISYLLELLELETPIASLRKNHASEKEVLKGAISFFAPLMRGDLYLLLKSDPESSYIHYNRARLPSLWKNTIFQSLINRRLGEIEINSFKGLNCNEHVNVPKALAHLQDTKEDQKAIAEMTLAKYYLGLIDPKVHNPKKAFTYLNRNRDNVLVNHIVCQIEMDYYLGLGNPEIFDLSSALGALERGLSFCENYPEIREGFSLRKGEVLLGLYGGETDVMSAIPILEEAKDSLMLYLIYKGVFGQEYKDTTLRSTYLEQGAKDGHALLVIYKSIELIKSGKPQEALNLLDFKGVCNLYASYIKARLYANNTLETYNPFLALRFFSGVIKEDYKDSRIRFIKFIWGLCTDTKITKEAVNFLTSKIEENYSSENLLEALCDNIDALNQLARESMESENIQAIPNEEENVDLPLAEGESSEGRSDDSDDTFSLVASIENEDSIAILSPEIEFLMNNLGGNTTWTRKELRPYLIEMGAIFKGKNISFPGVEGVFNYHEGHKGTKEFSLSKGYWKYLKRMIMERYDILLKEEL